MKKEEHFEERGLCLNTWVDKEFNHGFATCKTSRVAAKATTHIAAWRERNLAKAPPGYSVNLEGPRGHPPEGVTASDRGRAIRLNYNKLNNYNKSKIQIFTNVSKFYSNEKANFTIRVVRGGNFCQC